MKLLIISNNPLSTESSNGRTMLNMLNNFLPEELVNIYIGGFNPSIKKAKFYKVNEKKLLNFFNKGNYISRISKTYSVNGGKKTKKTSFKVLIRSVLWKRRKLYIEIKEVVVKEKIDIIIIQCGDSDFLINIATKLAKELNIPLISYNSEDYIFKTWNYIEKKKHRGLIFRFYFRRLLKSYNALYKTLSCSIYLTPYLKELYSEKYSNHDAFFIYNSSSFLNKFDSKYNDDGEVIYSGNLGVGRCDTLIEIAPIIESIFKKKLVVYSLTKDERIIDRISHSKSIVYKGSLTYDENIIAMKNAKLLIHCESFSPYYLKDTEHSFSTKIADSLSISVPFMLLAPESSSVYKYCKENNCCFVCKDLSEFRNELVQIKNIKNYVKSKLVYAEKCAKSNHSSSANSNKFNEIISAYLK